MCLSCFSHRICKHLSKSLDGDSGSDTHHHDADSLSIRERAGDDGRELVVWGVGEKSSRTISLVGEEVGG
jgi:hypothetical protein